MRLTLLLAGILAITNPVLAQDTASSSEAASLETAGRYEDALAAYQRLANANPRDHEARLAIARLEERLGHPDRAETVFRSVMLEDPTSVEATLGTGRTLIEQLHPEDAIDVLAAAERLAPQDPDVLSALGRAHRDAGHTGESLRYFERAAAASTTAGQRLMLERARAGHDHRIESRSFGEQYNGSTPDARATDLAVNFRVNDAVRVGARGQYQRKFDVSDARGGVGIEWRHTAYTTFAAQALIGPDNEVLPRRDIFGEAAYRYGSWVSSGNVRYFGFDGAHMTTFSPAVTFQPGDRLSLSLRYAFSLTGVDGFDGSTDGHTGQLRGSWLLRPRVTILAGYSYGIDDFDALSIDRVGAFTAHTGSAGVRVDLRTLTSLGAVYQYQSRDAGVRLQRLTVTIGQSF